MMTFFLTANAQHHISSAHGLTMSMSANKVGANAEYVSDYVKCIATEFRSVRSEALCYMYTARRGKPH